MSNSWGILCTSCGLLIKHYGPNKNNYIIGFFQECEKCHKDSLKLVRLPLDYFNNEPNRKFLTKEEIVEILI